MMHDCCISKSNDVLQVGWYSDNSGLHIDLDEDGSFPDYYEDENEIGVTQIPKFTEKVRINDRVIETTVNRLLPTSGKII